MGQEVRSELIQLLGRLYGTDKGRELSIRLSEGEDQEGLLAEYGQGVSEGRGKMRGYVYVLTNEAMPGLVKIGRSKHAAGARAKQIYKGDTGVPLPFDVHFECLFDDCIEAEAFIHDALADDRINPNREFFRLDPEEAALAVMDLRAGESCHSVVDSDLVVDTSVYFNLARELDCDFMYAVSALHGVKAEEVRPSLERFQERVEKTREINAAEVAQLFGDNNG